MAHAKTIITAGVLGAGLSVWGVAPAHATGAPGTPVIQESFRDVTVPPGKWTTLSPQGQDWPCLTAASAAPPLTPPPGFIPRCAEVQNGTAKPDPVGQGAFRMTDNSGSDGGGIVLDQVLPTKQGVSFKFDQYQYNSSTPAAGGADGISFFLIDGAQKDDALGEVGGGLGYFNLPGAVLGVGLDEFGNFSNPVFFSKGDKGPGVRPNSVVVRGAQTTGYQYIQGAKLTQSLAVDSATQRDPADRTVKVGIDVHNVLNVWIDFHDGKGDVPVISGLDLDTIPGQPKLPPTLKIGFASSTGDDTDFHEIRDFKEGPYNCPPK